MDRFNYILNSIQQELSEAAQQTYKGQKRSELKDSDFLFPETRSFPIVSPQDVPDAISNFGRMKGKMTYEAFLRKLYNKIKNKPEFVAALPEASKQQLGLKKKSSEASIVPVPVTNVPAPVTEDNPRLIKKELVDEKNNDNESQNLKTQIKKLAPSNPNNQVSLPHAEVSAGACKLKAGDKVRNINKACMHYGSEGIVQQVEPMPDNIGYVVSYETTNDGPTWKPGETIRKTEDQLGLLDMLPKTLLAQEDNENESPEQELTEYKEDFYEMSIASLTAIAHHAQGILNHLDMPHVKENLTESWLQGKIAITEDYMRTIHDFIMYVSEAADNVSAADRPGLWENIRRKKEREGKNYKPAKPGDKDRPDPEQWKKLQKDQKD